MTRTVRIGFTRGAGIGAALGTFGSLALYGAGPVAAAGAGALAGTLIGARAAARRRSARPTASPAGVPDPLLAARVETERARAEAIREREANRRRPRAEQDAAERRAYIRGAADFAGTDRDPPAA